MSLNFLLLHLQQLNNMVHEINPSAAENEGIVNSTSLEDVALSEVCKSARCFQYLNL